MTEFDILLSNRRGQKLAAHVRYVHPDHFVVEIDDMELRLKVLKNSEGKLECEDSEHLHSHLVTDICDQINARLYSFDDRNPENP
jgi:hypothetical protein